MTLKMETKKTSARSDRFYLSLANLIGLRGKSERELSDIVREGATDIIMIASGAFVAGTFTLLILQTEYLGPFPRALELLAMCGGIGAAGIGLKRMYATLQKYRRQVLDY